jgi:hypothetical protein
LGIAVLCQDYTSRLFFLQLYLVTGMVETAKVDQTCPIFYHPIHECQVEVCFFKFFLL